jgi:spermidine/putrescine transport system substrate-binding protein
MTNPRRRGPWGDSAADRLAAQLARQVGGGFSRRSFLRTAGVSAMAVGSSGLLAACGTEGTRQTAETCSSEDLSDTEKQIIFSNWPLYIDEKGNSYPTLVDFEEESGISVTYNTDVNDNNQFFAKVRNQLGACESAERDVFVLTDWMAARMVGLGWLQELDHANLPNVDANLVPSLKDPTWDPGRKHSVPWQSGLTGIAYNAKYTGEVSSFEELVTRADLKGRISLLSEMGDTMGFFLRMVGADPEDFTSDQWGEAVARLEEVMAAGQVRQFTGNEYARDLNKGDLVAAEAWSGDVMILQDKNPDIKFVVPEEGASLWSDNMLVPNKATHKANAEKLMNYYYEPEVAARLAAWVWHISPVEGAEAAMEEIDPSLVGNSLIFPTPEDLENTFGALGVDDKTRQEYDKQFNQIIGA